MSQLIAKEVDTRPFTEEELAEARRYTMVAQWSREDEAFIEPAVWRSCRAP